MVSYFVVTFWLSGSFRVRCWGWWTWGVVGRLCLFSTIPLPASLAKIHSKYLA